MWFFRRRHYPTTLPLVAEISDDDYRRVTIREEVHPCNHVQYVVELECRQDADTPWIWAGCIHEDDLLPFAKLLSKAHERISEEQ